MTGSPSACPPSWWAPAVRSVLSIWPASAGAQSWQLRMVKLEIDHEHSLPRIQHGSMDDSVVADGLAASPLVVSADAKIVHAIDISGAHREHTIAR